MSEFTLKGRVEVDAKQAVSALDQTTAAAGELNKAQQETAAGAKAAAAGSRDVADAVRTNGTASREAAAAASGLNQETREAASAMTAAAASSRGHGAAARAAAQGVDRLDASNRRAAASAGAMRAASQNLGYQINDITMQMSLGTPAMTIFAQQGGQTAAALAGMGGVVGRVAGFLSGPYGAAILGAVAITGALATKLGESADAADGAEKAHKSLADAIKELDEVSGRANKTQSQSVALSMEVTRQARLQEIAKRGLLKAELELAIAEQKRANADTVGGRAANFGAYGVAQKADQDVADLERQLRAQDKLIAESEKSLRGGIAKAVSIQVAAATDKSAAATQKYEAALSSLRAEFERGAISREELFKRELAITKTRDDEIAADRKAASTKRDTDKATREATKANRELEQSLDGMLKRYDPATAAAQAYAEALKDIAALEKAGKIDAGTARKLRFEAETKAVDEQFKNTTEDLSDSFRHAMTTPIIDVAATAKDEFSRAFEHATGRLQDSGIEAINAMSQLVGGKLGRVLAAAGGLMQVGRAKDAPEGSFESGVQSVIKPLVNKLDAAFGKGGTITKTLGAAYAGAQIGGTTGALASSLFGFKGSNTGSQIGGALGSVIGGPLGAAIGGIAGSVLGGMFKKKVYGTANVTSVDGDASVSGNKGSARTVASGLAGSIQDGIQQIADMLGGDVGNFNVSIGTYKGKYRVDTGGRTAQLKFNGDTSNLHDFGKDGEAEALAFALRDAVADGGVKGLSAAVQAALQNNSDINKAIADALKVKGLEDLLANRDNPFATLMRDFEKQAKQRLDIARKYGFDLVEIEKINAEERAKLVTTSLEQATGSIKQLLDDLRFGDRAEGSFGERRAALVSERDRLAGLARGGDQDALNKLAAVSQQLLDLDREGYATTGGFAQSRNETINLLEELVRQTEQRIKSAASKAQSDPALTQTNAALNENNDQNAKMLAALQTNNQYLNSILAAWTGGGQAAALAALMAKARTS